VAHEIALFWAVLAGFWLFDNVVLAPVGGDLLGLDRRGRPHYIPATRLSLRGRDSLLLNPLNPFELALPSARVSGFIDAQAWRAARRAQRQAAPVLRALGWLGVVYLLVLAVLLVASWHWHFGTVLLVLLGWHLLAWAIGLVLLLRGRRRLGLGAEALVGLTAEALFVPAYTLGLAKRAARRRLVDLPSLSLGLRALGRMPAGAARELWHWRLSSRLDELLLDLGLTGAEAPLDARRAELQRWADTARHCLQRHG
jgi:hypothetical protein